jgi:hypothetical protein
MLRRLPSLRALLLVLFAVGPLVAATVEATGRPTYTARDASFDDTTSGAVSHPESAFALGSQPMQAAQQLARAHWGVDPCGGKVEVVWSALSPQINAQSSWTNPSSAYDNPTQNGDCKVTFNPVASFDWPKFCTVMVHEYGHLAGNPHSPDQNDVMAAYYSKPVAECDTRQPGAVDPAPAAPARKSAQVAPLGTVARAVKRKPVQRKRAARLRRRASR